MKCEYCDNDKIWKGSLRDGGLVCEHCANDDGMFNVHMTNGSVVRVPKGSMIVTVGAGGAGGGSASQGAICVGAGGSGYSSSSQDVTCVGVSGGSGGSAQNTKGCGGCTGEVLANCDCELEPDYGI